MAIHPRAFLEFWNLEVFQALLKKIGQVILEAGRTRCNLARLVDGSDEPPFFLFRRKPLGQYVDAFWHQKALCALVVGERVVFLVLG